MTEEPKNYEDLQALADELRRPLRTLYALSGRNDPWMAGVSYRKRDGEWFAAQWQRLGVTPGTHIRRFHYRLISQATPVMMPDGKPYINSLECSGWLYVAALTARYLGLIAERDITDERNAEVKIYSDGTESAAAISSADALAGYAAPALELPKLTVTAPKIPQPYMVELWIEKSTMNDVIMPIAERYGMNVLVGTGETSLTRCIELCDRANADGRPVRILYISDFDPGGQSMPLAAARKIEFELRRNMPELDVQVRDIALTHDQCVEYELPRTPMKESEKRADKFEQRFGEGATELDALEALHPGVLAQIIEREIERYYDADLDDQIEEAVAEAQDELDRIRDDVHEQHADEIQGLLDEHERVQAAINAYRVKAQPIYTAIKRDLDAAAPAVADMVRWPDTSDFAAAEDMDPLFDSNRSYLEQMNRYKDQQGKDTERGDHAIVCLVCKGGFTPTRSGAQYCSKSCRNAAHYSRQKADRAQHSASYSRTCDVCQNDFRTIRPEARFCGKKCSSTWHNAQRPNFGKPKTGRPPKSKTTAT